MERFQEIEGAMLECISTSEASYVDVKNSSVPLIIKGSSLVFDLGVFVIENPFMVFSLVGEKIKLNELIGERVKSAYSIEEEIRVIFESDSYISISMKDKYFIGPEAASYSPKRGNIIVFN